MRLVPAGEFTMGGSDSVNIIHQVYIDAYFIDIYEVSNALYKTCVIAGVCTEPKDARRYIDSSYANHPVVYLEWNQAATYCVWRGGNLPTEGQWEKAARGTDGRIYPWGNEFDGSSANFCDRHCSYEWASNSDDGYEYTAPVGSYASGVSPYGIYDMAGNVWEWVADWFLLDNKLNPPLSNPLGPDSGEDKLLRGGSWYSEKDLLRSYSFMVWYPDYFSGYIGFRCARDANP